MLDVKNKMTIECKCSNFSEFFLAGNVKWTKLFLSKNVYTESVSLSNSESDYIWRPDF